MSINIRATISTIKAQTKAIIAEHDLVNVGIRAGAAVMGMSMEIQGKALDKVNSVLNSETLEVLSCLNGNSVHMYNGIMGGDNVEAAFTKTVKANNEGIESCLDRAIKKDMHKITDLAMEIHAAVGTHLVKCKSNINNL